MGIRQRLNEHRTLSGSVAAILILSSLAFVLRGACSSPTRELGSPREKRFFTVDDGDSWFAEESSNIPPFKHGGKTAYGVKVYRCPDGTEFVSHLERYNEADKKRFEQLMAEGGAVLDPVALARAAEVKRPGGDRWIRWSPQTNDEYQRTIQPNCPSGSGHVEPVLPK